jgi:uncharacterized membrane protein YwzB
MAVSGYSFVSVEVLFFVSLGLPARTSALMWLFENTHTHTHTHTHTGDGYTFIAAPRSISMPICIYTNINTYIHTYIVACEEFCVDEVNYSLQVKYFCTCEEFCVDEVNYSLQVKYFVPARSSALMR